MGAYSAIVTKSSPFSQQHQMQFDPYVPLLKEASPNQQQQYQNL